jgi:uncharacterized protein (DUF58 family)
MPLKSLNLNLKPLIKKLEISLKRGYTEETVTSTFRSVFRGKGLEFDRFRVYSPADDAKEIDWKASLKAQDLLVRVLTEERQISIAFLLAVSNSMIFTSEDKLKCEYAAELVATLSYAMIEAGDSVSLIMFNDKIVKEIRGSAGMNQFYKITKALEDASLYGGDFDLNVALRYATKIFKNGTIIFIVSDFINMPEEWRTHLDVMARKYDMIGLMVRDKRDNSLEGTSGQYVLGNPYTGDDMLVDVNTIKVKYAQFAKQQVEDIQGTFQHVGADFMMIETNQNFVQPVIGLFRRRQHRWR